MKLSAFHFREGKTFIHRLDPRVKLVAIASLSSVLLFADLYQIALVGILVLFLGFIGRVNLARSFWEIKPILFLLGFIFLIHSFTTPGDSVLSVWELKLTIEGIIHGWKIVSRLVFIVSLGFVYSTSTDPEGTRSAIEWFLRPFPVNEKILGTSASMGARFFPLVVEDTKRIQEAQKARFAEGASVLRRLINMVSALLVRTVRRAEKISLAMDARCYSTDKSSPFQLHASTNDHIVLSSVLALVAFLHLTMFYWQ